MTIMWCLMIGYLRNITGIFGHQSVLGITEVDFFKYIMKYWRALSRILTTMVFALSMIL